LNFRHGEIGVHAAAGTGKTRRHSLSRREYAFAHVGGTLATLITEALERNARDVQAQVDAIEQRARKLAAIPLDLLGQTGAFSRSASPQKPRVHRGDEHESREVRRGAAGARS
jgi:hypothetical protein